LDQLILKGSQVVIATHSPIIMSYPEAKIFQFSEAGVKPIVYEETEHYRVTRSFLEAPERMLGHLLGRRGTEHSKKL
jgi:predicted ATPase